MTLGLYDVADANCLRVSFFKVSTEAEKVDVDSLTAWKRPNWATKFISVSAGVRD